MAGPLLTDFAGTDRVVARQWRAYTRFVVWMRLWSLDQKLARGVCPDDHVTLALRAHQLHSLATRRLIASELRELVRVARRPRGRFDRGVCLSCEVRGACGLLERLAARLESHSPVEAAGVARVRVLLRDGCGPLFADTAGGALEQSLHEAMLELEPRPVIAHGRGGPV
jgi:hypothetical protein